MGESWMDRLEMALTLRPFRPATVPLNFLHPIPGTPLGCHTPLRPLEILRIIAVYRFLLPTSNIGVYGGREANLRDVQALIFNAGASAFMLGNYLTTTGRPADIDRQMLRDLELTLVEHKRESSL
jgi:biotin synthase